MEGADVYYVSFLPIWTFWFLKTSRTVCSVLSWTMRWLMDFQGLKCLDPGQMARWGRCTKHLLSATPISIPLILNLKVSAFAHRKYDAESIPYGAWWPAAAWRWICYRSDKKFRTNVTQYSAGFLQVFKLSPYKKEFEDIFTGKLDIYNSEFFQAYM